MIQKAVVLASMILVQKRSRNSEGVHPLDSRKSLLKWQMVLKPQANPTSETEYFVLSSIRAAIPRR